MRLITLLLLLTLTFGCAGTKFYFFGVDTAIVTEASRKDALKVVAGAAASVATHIGGHYLAAEIVGVDVEQRGLNEHFTNGSESDYAWAARGGFVLQTVVNTALTSFEATRYSNFTKGYTLTTALQVWTYPLRHQGEGDFHTSGDNGFEYGLLSAFAIHNMLRVPWFSNTKQNQASIPERD